MVLGKLRFRADIQHNHGHRLSVDIGYLTAILIGIVIAAFTYWIWLSPTLYRPLAQAGIKHFHDFLNGLPLPMDEYRYFTTGYIIWSETNISEIEQTIKKMSVAVNGFGPIPTMPRFLLHADEKSKNVYFVPTSEKEFDWDSIAHYEDYVKE